MDDEVRTQRHTARIAEGASIAENVAYEELVTRVLAFIIDAALAKAADRCSWEHEEMRRYGLQKIAFARDGRALWWDRDVFGAEEAEAVRERARTRFAAKNQLDEGFFEKLDRDLRDRLRRAGYSTNPLISSMCDLFEQIASEADERSANAQRQLADEIVGR